MIAHAFYLRSVIETWWRGTLKIACSMREAGSLEVRVGAVVVT